MCISLPLDCTVCLFLDFKLKDYLRPALPLPPPPHPLFSFYPGLFQVSGSDLGLECQWSAHSQQLVLMAVPHASNRGKAALKVTGQNVTAYNIMGDMVSVYQAYTAQRENNYKITRQDYTDTVDVI